MQPPRLGMNSPSSAFLVWLLRIDELLCISHHLVIIQSSVNENSASQTQEGALDSVLQHGFLPHTILLCSNLFSCCLGDSWQGSSDGKKRGYQEGQDIDVTSPCSQSLTVGGSSYQEMSTPTRKCNCKFPKFSLKLPQKGIYWCRRNHENHVWLAFIFKPLSE